MTYQFILPKPKYIYVNRSRNIQGVPDYHVVEQFGKEKLGLLSGNQKLHKDSKTEMESKQMQFALPPLSGSLEYILQEKVNLKSKLIELICGPYDSKEDAMQSIEYASSLRKIEEDAARVGVSKKWLENLDILICVIELRKGLLKETEEEARNSKEYQQLYNSFWNNDDKEARQAKQLDKVVTHHNNGARSVGAGHVNGFTIHKMQGATIYKTTNERGSHGDVVVALTNANSHVANTMTPSATNDNIRKPKRSMTTSATDNQEPTTKKTRSCGCH
jgi:hypothetical protein